MAEQTEAEMMAEWEQMAAADPAAAAGAEAAPAEEGATGENGEPARVLNQDEIDLLLGFDGGVQEDRSNGIYAILDRSMMAYEKLPMLEVVFDRLVRML